MMLFGDFMAKRKKITVKYFLKADAKPITKNGKKHFPVYMQVIYDGGNTKVKVLSGDLEPPRLSALNDIEHNVPLYVEENVSEAKFELIKKNHKKDFIHLNEKVILGIMKYEIAQSPRKYSFKGLGDRLLAYNLSVLSEFEGSVQAQLIDSYLQDKLSYREFNELFRHRNTSLNHIFYYTLNMDKEFFRELNEKVCDYLTAYWTLRVFIHIQEIPLKAYHWLAFGFKEKYKLFLINLKKENSYLDKMEEMRDNIVKDLSSMFYINPDKIDYYTQIIGNADINKWGGTYVYKLG